MNHFIFALYLLSLFVGVGVLASLMPQRKGARGLSEALVINALIGLFTIWGASLLYSSVNLQFAWEPVRVFLGGTALIMGALIFYLPKQTLAIFDLKVGHDRLFGVMSLCSAVCGVLIAVLPPPTHVYSLSLSLLCLLIAVVYSQVVYLRHYHQVFKTNKLKYGSALLSLLFIGLGLGEGLLFGDQVVQRGVTISLPLIYLLSSVVLWCFAGQAFPRVDTVLSLPDTLTAKESEVAQAVCQGWSNKKIASELHMAPSTVKNHLSAVFKKLNVTNRVALIKSLQGI